MKPRFPLYLSINVFFFLGGGQSLDTVVPWHPLYLFVVERLNAVFPRCKVRVTHVPDVSMSQTQQC